MNRIFRILATATMALLMSVPAFAGDAALKAQIEQWDKLFNAGDPAGVAALYTKDAELLPPNSDTVKGRSAIQEFWQGAIDKSEGEVSLESVELHMLGDTAIDIGKYSGTSGTAGKYLVVWTKTESGWLMHRDIWNSSLDADATE